jgi:phosphoribosyl 1,2-cyclic phosphate phosphodiesterase
MSKRLKFTILGCGSSPGVPRIGGDWGACDPQNPKNRRRRASLLIEQFQGDGKTTVVVDTGPDFREQMLSANVGWADGVLYTHGHADHIHGIDDLRSFVINRHHLVNIYCDDFTSERLYEGFGYCFKSPEGSQYPPILRENRIAAGQSFEVSGEGGNIEILPYKQQHGSIHSLGFRMGNFAYSSDISDMLDETIPLLQGLDVWVLDALQYREHSSHFSVEQALFWVDKIKPKRAIFTHMHTPLDYDTLKSELPGHIEPAYDGMVIEV